MVAESRRLSVELQMPKKPISTGSSVTFSVVVSWKENPLVAAIHVTIFDSEGNEIHEYTRKTSSSGIANEACTIPEDGPLGTYTIQIDAEKEGYVASRATANFEVI